MASLTGSFVVSAGNLTARSHVASVQGLRCSAPVACPLRSAQMPLVESRVAIRFTRRGRKKLPFFRIIAVDSRVRRDGRPIEELGWFDPVRKETNLNAPAIKKWLDVGAQPSESVKNLLKKAMVIE